MALPRNVVARDENLSWVDLKLIRRKGSNTLWTQVNIQLQSPVSDVPLLEKNQQGFEHKDRKSNSEADL